MLWSMLYFDQYPMYDKICVFMLIMVYRENKKQKQKKVSGLVNFMNKLIKENGDR